MLATGPQLCPQLFSPQPLGSPALLGRVTQVEIRAERRLQIWAIYGHSLGPLGPHPCPGTGRLVCEIQTLRWAPAGVLSIYSSGTAWVHRGSSSFSGLGVGKCSFVEHNIGDPCCILGTQMSQTRSPPSQCSSLVEDADLHTDRGEWAQ